MGALYVVQTFLTGNLASIVGLLMMVLTYKLGSSGLATLNEWLYAHHVKENAQWAYDNLAQLARKNPNKYLDMGTEFLKVFVDAMRLSGLEPDEADKAKAKMIANSLHEQDTRAGVDHKSLAAERAMRDAANAGEARPDSAV